MTTVHRPTTRIGWELLEFSRSSLANLEENLRSINYDELVKAPLFPEDHESNLELEFPRVEGLPARDGGVERVAGTDRGPAAQEDRAIRGEIEDDDAIEDD